MYENGSSGDTSEDVMFDIQNPRRSELSIQQGRGNVNQEKDYHGLWSNSSRLKLFYFLYDKDWMFFFLHSPLT